MRHFTRWSEGRLWGRAGLAIVLTVVVVAALFGEFEHGYLWRASSPADTRALLVWLFYSTANSAAAIFAVTVLSSVGGCTLATLVSERHGERLLRWMEFTCTLPALVLLMLWFSHPPVHPWVAFTAVVSAQRTFQVAVLVYRASRHRPSPTGTPSLHPVPEFGAAYLRRWLPLLWVAGAHSALLLTAEATALVLLGFLPETPHTWPSTLALAATTPHAVSMASVSWALLATVGVTAALWSQSQAPK